MKFGDNLSSHCIIEWKAKYIDYKRLKKVIKACQTHPDTQKRLSLKGLSASKHSLESQVSDSNIASSSALNASVTASETFLSALEQEVEKTTEFTLKQIKLAEFRFAKIEHAVNKFKELQLTIPNDRARLLKEIKLMKKNFEGIFRNRKSNVPDFDEEIQMQEQHVEGTSKDQAPDSSVSLSEAKSRIRDAFSENYRYLEMILDFITLNNTALNKIVKKFNKQTNQAFAAESKTYLEKVEGEKISSDLTKVRSLLSKTEDLLVTFEGKDRKV